MTFVTKKFYSYAAFALVVAVSINAANATITLVASDSNLIPNDSGVPSLSSSFDMLTGNAVVVSASARFGSASTALDATFAGNGAPDFSFVQGSGDRATVGTFVWLNPANTSGTVEVTAAGSARLGYAVYSLDNVGGVVDMPDSNPNDGIATDGAGMAGAPEGFGENGNLDTTFDIMYKGVAGGYAIHTLSGEGPGNVTHEITGDNVDTTVLSHQNGDNGIFITAVSSGGQIAADGEYDTSFAYYRAGALSTVVLEMVPEPSSISLLGLAGLALSMLRRR